MEENNNLEDNLEEDNIYDVNIDLENSNPDVDIINNNIGDDTSESFEEKMDAKSNETIDASKLRQSLFTMKDQIDDMLKLLQNASIKLDSPTASLNILDTNTDGTEEILGIFTGNMMRDDNGKEYAIAPNYASKSKLVEGDKLKLNITPSGSFIYKQVEQIPRKRLVGELVFDSEVNQWTVVAENKPYKILKASVTFYKGNIGDEAVILVPETGSCSWGAVDNIIRKN